MDKREIQIIMKKKGKTVLRIDAENEEDLAGVIAHYLKSTYDRMAFLGNFCDEADYLIEIEKELEDWDNGAGNLAE